MALGRVIVLVMRLVKALLPLENQGFLVLAEVACYLEAGSIPNPDMAVVRQDRWVAGVVDGWFKQAPDLAVKVVSPGNRKLHRKADLYFDHGAEQVWIVNPTTRTIGVLTADRLSEACCGEAVDFHGCRVAVDDLFAGLPEN